jgi:hypothetical protein
MTEVFVNGVFRLLSPRASLLSGTGRKARSPDCRPELRLFSGTIKRSRQAAL